MQHLTVENVQRIRRVDLVLGPITVLVGPVGAGKTTLLRCVEAACGGVSGLAMKGDGRIRADGRAVREATRDEAPRSTAVRPDFDVRALAEPSALATGSPLCGDRGQRLAGALGTLRLAHPEVYDRVIRDLRRVLPSLRALRLPPLPDGRVEIRGDFVDATDVPHHAFGGGTLLALAHLVTLHADRPRPPAPPGGEGASPKDRPVLLFDEPETGLHPKAQLELARCVAEVAAAGEVQVVIATHSPYVVEAVGLDAVWAVGARERGVVAFPLRDHPKLQLAQGLTAGQLWSLVGDDWMKEFDRP